MIKSLFLLAALLAACSWAITCPAPYSACGTSRCYNSAIQCCKQPGDVIGSKGSGECPTDIASGCQLPFTGCGPNLCYDDDTQCCVFSNNIYSVADKTSPLCGGMLIILQFTVSRKWMSFRLHSMWHWLLQSQQPMLC